MTKSNCFPTESLKEYLAGELGESESSRIELHLAECLDCEQTIVELEKEPDTTVELLRGKSAVPKVSSERSPAPSVIVRAVESAKALMDDEEPRHFSKWTPPPGDFGAYELIRPLGRGGMAAVYLARHRQLGKLVAIKMLPTPFDGEQASAARFQREIRAAGALIHPAIVLATDAGVYDGLHYLVMEFIDGLDLSQLARALGPLVIADACELGRQVALGLSHAHAAGIVHRDIKPSNLMLDASGRAKILDFGLAQLSLWDEASAELTTVGQLMGTLDYMAPEQAERSGAVDYRADLYALGSTLFKLLCGRAPLAATPNLSPLEKLRMLASHQPPKLDTLRPDAPPELVQLIGSLLARTPESRPTSAAHVAEQLAPLAADADLSALVERAKSALQSPDNSAKRVPSLVQSVAAASLVQNDRRPTRNRIRKWLIAAAFLPLLALAGVLIVLETQKGQLVIESEVADVQVKLLQDGQPNREFTLQLGATTTRLYAGQYEVTLASPSDSITLDNDRFNIRQGETVIARVQQKPLAEKSDAASTIQLATGSTSSELRYDGKPLSGWLEQLQRDRSPQAIVQSFAAIRALSCPETSKQTTEALVSILPSLDGGANLHVKNSAGAPILRSSINEEAIAILQKCHPNERFVELLIRLMDSKDSKLKILVLNPAIFSSYSSAEPVLHWLEKHFSSVDSESPESDELRATAIHCLKTYAQGNPSSNPESGKIAAYALRLLKQWVFVGQDFWLMEPFPKRLDDWYVDYRQEVLRRAVEAIVTENTSPQNVAKATMILSSLPAYGLNEVNDEVRKSLVSAIESRLTSLSTDANRLLGLANVDVQFAAYSEIDPIRQQTMEFGFRVDGTNSPKKNAVSETIELLDFCRVLNEFESGDRLDLEQVKLLITATEAQFSRVRSRFEPFHLDHLRAMVSWPSLRIGSIQGSTDQAESDSVFAQALKLTPQDWMGFFIHIRAANLAGIALEEPQPEQASNRLPTTPSSPAEPQQRSSNAQQAADPTYEGLSLSHWLGVLKNDRSRETLLKALTAVGAMVNDASAPQVSETILGMTRSSDASIANMSTSTRTELDAAALRILAKANQGEKFGNAIVHELEANDEQRSNRIIGALNSASIDGQLAPIVHWLATSPIPLSYSDNVARRLDGFLKGLLVKSRVLPDSGKSVIDIALRHPKLGQAFLFRVYLLHAWNQSAATGWPTDFPATVHGFAKATLVNKEATAIEVMLAACALLMHPYLELESEDLKEPIRQRLGWLASSRERLFAAVETDSETANRCDFEAYFRANVRFPLNSQTAGYLGPQGFIALRAWVDDAEFLSVLALMNRLALTESCAVELREIQEIAKPGYEEALRVLPPVKLENNPQLTWPFGEPEMSQLPAAYRQVSQQSWMAYVIYEQISKTFATIEEQKKNAEARNAAWKIDEAIKTELKAGEAATGVLVGQGELDWAKAQIKKYDNNGDGALTEDEWSSMIIKPIGADLNGDGRISIAEYAAFRARKR